MARTESVAVAGYYPTPQSQIPYIAGRIERLETPEDQRAARIVAVDPCAGDGEAIEALCKAIGAEDDTDYFTCEMEKSRHRALTQRLRRGVYHESTLYGDAFRISFDILDDDGAGLLFLNPPYDTDRVAGRLEEKFLKRFTATLREGGLLVFIVPHYALKASADTLGRNYRDLSCFRFTGADFEIYKQVVLFARKSSGELFDADQRIVEVVNGWASDAASIPEFPALDEPPTYSVPASQIASAFSEWKLKTVDVRALAERFTPWHETGRSRGLVPVARIVPDLPVSEIMHRTYEVAMPPRPAHIAAGIAAGLFNGHRIEPDDPASGLPPLLVKGVFDREWRTIEEKVNKDGDKTGEVQVQQPKLVVTVLDLARHQYHTVGAGTGTGSDVATLGIGGLLKFYGTALMGVMERQCRILYDPRKDADKVSIPAAGRTLYRAQAHAVRAQVTLLRERPGRSPYLLGEIGSGKTTVALMTARTMGAKRLLALCPPHLLDTWRDEVASVLPGTEFRVLESISDVDAVASVPADKALVAVLSRETAKLGHGWTAVTGDGCPRCGASVPKGVDLAKKRARCASKSLLPRDEYAKMALELALYLRPFEADDVSVRNILRGRLADRYPKPRKPPKYTGIPRDLAMKILGRLVFDYSARDMHGEDMQRALLWLMSAAPSPDALVRLIPLAHYAGDWAHFAECLALLSPSHGFDAVLARGAVAALPRGPGYGGYNERPERPEERHDSRLERLEDGEAITIANCQLTRVEGKLRLDAQDFGNIGAATRLLAQLVKIAAWGWTEECGEPLYQALPEPRRHPLAQYIVNRHKKTFDFLVMDEGHEYATEGSAQERAAHRLTTLGLPTVFMTGSVMNGYATSLFTNMWALSPDFRSEFDRDDLTPFNDRYGYRKRIVQDRKDGEVVTFGSNTDRVERSERDAGVAPGVLPLFLFRHLLPSAVTIHKADLRIDLPDCKPSKNEIIPSGPLHAEYNKLLKALTKQIRADRFKEGLAGKLFGALSELPSFLDRATDDVGNNEEGTYEIRYPESCGGGLIASAKMQSARAVLAKEDWLLSRVDDELAEGRNVLVFGWHLGLLPRLARLIEKHIGEPAPILYADKVPTGKRQAWIDREIIRKKRRVMIANPVAISTGLNNLVHFSTEVWHENPACNPIVYRQAVGRVDRIGQKKETRILFGYYANTLQANLYELLTAKVAISTATDGLDPESALRASGIVEDEYLTGLSIGKQLWAMLSEDSKIFSDDVRVVA